jgi:hypothetical protein
MLQIGTKGLTLREACDFIVNLINMKCIAPYHMEKFYWSISFKAVNFYSAFYILSYDILTGGMLNNFSTSITSALFPIHVNRFATSHLCLIVPPPLAALGATALVGDLPPAPTEVELGAGG